MQNYGQTLWILFKQFQTLTFIHLCFSISFLVSGLVVNIFQAILFCTVRLYSKRLYRKINYYLTYTFQCQLVFMSEWWAGTKLHIYTEDFNDKYVNETGLLIMNHSYELDWLMGWQFCEYVGVLGNCKAFTKKSIQYMPSLGWCWKFAEYIFLSRDFEKDKETIHKQIGELGDFPDPVCILLAAEGTRLSPTKLKNSQEFARDKGLPILKHHLLPRTKGFIACLKGMQNKINIIYDCQVAFKKDAEFEPTMTNLLYGRPVEGHLYTTKINVKDIPENEEEAIKWLYDLYEKKDRMQESFYTTGSFFTTSGVKAIEQKTLPRRIWPLVNTLAWNIAILTPSFSYLISWLIEGELIKFSTGISILVILYLMMKMLIGMSQIKKGSSYGEAKKK